VRPTPSYISTYTERRAQFTIDPDSGALSATWTNPDMTCMPLLLPRPAPADPSARADSPLVAVVDGPNFFWVGNVADYNAASGANATPVVSASPRARPRSTLTVRADARVPAVAALLARGCASCRRILAVSSSFHHRGEAPRPALQATPPAPCRYSSTLFSN
jgi:hypothetical protein